MGNSLEISTCFNASQREDNVTSQCDHNFQKEPITETGGGLEKVVRFSEPTTQQFATLHLENPDSPEADGKSTIPITTHRTNFISQTKPVTFGTGECSHPIRETAARELLTRNLSIVFCLHLMIFREIFQRMTPYHRRAS